MSYQDIKVGDKEDIKRLIGRKGVFKIAELLLDRNPVDLDLKYGKVLVKKL